MRKIRTGCLTVVGLFVLLIAVAAIFGNSTTKTKQSASKHHASSSSSTSSPTSATATSIAASTSTAVKAAVVKRAHHHRFPQYAGIGATVGDFTHDNTMFCLSCSLVTGEAAYTIESRRNGRVTGYDMNEAFKPAAGDAARLFLVTGTMIPGPITAPVRQSADCIDYRVPQLLKLIGVEYAEASTSPGANFATMQAVASPGCP